MPSSPGNMISLTGYREQSELLTSSFVFRIISCMQRTKQVCHNRKGLGSGEFRCDSCVVYISSQSFSLDPDLETAACTGLAFLSSHTKSQP